jgi:hypothetical protein
MDLYIDLPARRGTTDGPLTYLEATSDRNTILYERLGFKLQNELRFAGSPSLRLLVLHLLISQSRRHHWVSEWIACHNVER